MKRLFSHSMLTGFIATLSIIASTQTLYAENLNVLGNLEAKGNIQISAQGQPAPVNLSNTTYSYLSGDTIKTGKGTGILNITGVGRIGLAEGTEATVTETDMGADMNLISGAIGYALTPNSNFTIKVAGMTLRPARSPLQKVSAGAEELVIGWVAVGEDGAVEVGAHSGRVEVSQGGMLQVLESGQHSILQNQDGKLLMTQLGAGGGFIGGLSGFQVLGIITAVALGSWAVYEVAIKDDDEPTSP